MRRTIEEIVHECIVEFEPNEDVDVFDDMPAHTIDKICKKKYGHVNWARFDKIKPAELAGNPCEFDYENGVVYFKNAYLV